MRSLIILLSLILPALCFSAQPNPADAFSGLKTKAVTEGNMCHYQAKVSFDSSIGKAPIKFMPSTYNPNGGTILALESKVDRTKPQVYVFEFDEGGSCDPQFNVYLKGNDTPIGHIDADHLIVPGNGFVYVARGTNNWFVGREKWAISESAVSQVPQPFYYVGMQTIARKHFKIMSAIDGGVVVASVPAGEKVDVILGDSNGKFLIKTRFGLIGWIEYSPYYEERLFEEIYVHGD